VISVTRCPCYRYTKVISTNLGTREKTRRFTDIHVTDTTRQYLPTLEPERRQDVYQISMIQIPQGSIYHPWNQREDKTFLRCPCYRYHKVISTNLGIREKETSCLLFDSKVGRYYLVVSVTWTSDKRLVFSLVPRLVDITLWYL
jgi:hypothetical protein